ncbi:unnamed protein product [Cuscuta epithymum]|uniref:Uncharacterized protein n=1 Tax=Cuscuta epithymum TaxID=186058 RepID=A0AAV0EYV6_9ASTE|nr:unnamed protein product [Cuscuta epithymum]
MFNFPHSYAHSPNRSWIFWTNDNTVSIIHEGSQSLSMIITNIGNPIPFLVSIVHGSSDRIQRTQLWDELRLLISSNSSSPWIVAGDFKMLLLTSMSIGVTLTLTLSGLSVTLRFQ